MVSGAARRPALGAESKNSEGASDAGRIEVPVFTWPNWREQLGPTFARIAERAEQAGFASLWLWTTSSSS